MVRQAQKHRRDPQGGDDQRGVRAGRYRCVEQGGGRRLALQELGADYAGILCHRDHHGMGQRSAIADEKLRLVEKVIQGRDFTAMEKPSMPSMPGSARARPCLRQCASPDLDAQSRPHDPALGGVGGAGTGRAFRCPLAVRRQTEGSTRSGFLFMSAMSATLVVGPTGAGKSVLLALMAQVPALRRCQVFAFDFGGSIRAAALAMGGDWHDLGGGLTEAWTTSVSLQPLARITTRPSAGRPTGSSRS
jgi:type IV secretion system protein VirB4